MSLNSSSPLQANLNSVTFKRANLCYPGSYCYGYIGTDPACDMILGFALTGEGIGATPPVQAGKATSNEMRVYKAGQSHDKTRNHRLKF